MDEGLHCNRVGHVGGDRHESITAGQGSRRSAQLLFIPARNGDASAFGQKGSCDGQADAAPPSSYQNSLVVESLHGCRDQCFLVIQKRVVNATADRNKPAPIIKPSQKFFPLAAVLSSPLPK